MQFCSDAIPQKCNYHGPMILDVGRKNKDNTLKLIISLFILIFLGCSSRYKINCVEKFKIISNEKEIKVFDLHDSDIIADKLSKIPWQNNYVTYAIIPGSKFLVGNGVSLIILDGNLVGEINGNNSRIGKINDELKIIFDVK